jgi:hypothetical protein
MRFIVPMLTMTGIIPKRVAVPVSTATMLMRVSIPVLVTLRKTALMRTATVKTGSLGHLARNVLT